LSGASRPPSDPAAAPYLRIDGITKSFGEVVAVDNVSLDIARGEFFALLGPSGCGKTTLLRMLAGLETPDAGRIVIDGVDMTETPPYARPVNMMFQSYALFPHMSVAQNIAFGLRQDGMAKPAMRQRVAEMLDLVQMPALAGRRPHQLSGGQRQRVALARALAKQPKLLLLDEPLAALDRKLREQTQFELMQIQERIGITFIIVTHDQAEAMTMASRLAVMDHGTLRQVGGPREVYEAPASRFVADFIGAVNLLKARVVDKVGDRLVLDSPDCGTLMSDGGDGVALGEAVTLALRPEKIVLDRTAPDAPHNRVQGTLREAAYLGGLSIYRIELETGIVLRATRPNTERLAAPDFVRDQPVWVTWSPSAATILAE
jgi:putrescine transport system ATP-binding protein